MTTRSAIRCALLGACAIGLSLLGPAVAPAAQTRGEGTANEALTILSSPASGVASVSVIEPDNTRRVVWRCPHNRFCGELVSAAWAPDGRRLALSLTEFALHSLYPGVHVIDTRTGHDVNLTGFRHDVSGRVASDREWKALSSHFGTAMRRFGCIAPSGLAWSPDGSKIAYACPVYRLGRGVSRIHIVNADGSRPRLLRTGALDAAWPAWSPDGTRIAFSAAPELPYDTTPARPKAGLERSGIYIIGLGGGLVRVTNHGVAPAWSRDGTTIAYRAACGRIRLVTPAGRDVTPGGLSGRCPGLTPGWPAWSGDGKALAIGTVRGVVLADPKGLQAAPVPASAYHGVTLELRAVVRPAAARQLQAQAVDSPAASTAGAGFSVTLPLRASNGVYSLSLIAPDGSRHEVWHCPRRVYCGELTSVSWAPGGTRVALSFDEFGGHSLYPGLHVIDTATGQDRKLFGLQRSPNAALAAMHRFGCWNPVELSWSPDGDRIAYSCATLRNRYKSSEIHIIDADGTHPRLLHTGTVGAAWPSWSPDGTRIAFSTGNWPREGVRTNTDQPKRVLHSVIYSVGVSGADRRRIATGAQPSWSPDGTAIAYRSDCGGRVRLAAPDGGELTPSGSPTRCPGIGPGGVPAWAPDGSRVVIGNEGGVFLINPDGSDLTWVQGSLRAGLAFEIRPALTSS